MNSAIHPKRDEGVVSGLRKCLITLAVVAISATAAARDVPEVFPIAGGRTEVRFDNRCIVLYGPDQRMMSVTQYCAASQVNAAIVAARRHFGGQGSSGSGPTPTVTSVRCESRDGRRAECRADATGGVRLASRLSSASCEYGRDWGYDSQRIWVSNGCRAIFEVQTAVALPVTMVTCESRGGRRAYCPAETLGGVRLANKLSSTACDQNRDWGYDKGGIWVDNGCRAVFEVRGVVAPPILRPDASVTCESRDGRRAHCRADTVGGVRLARKLSSSACEFRRDWGFDQDGIWVSNGCRAVFEIGGIR